MSMASDGSYVREPRATYLAEPLSDWHGAQVWDSAWGRKAVRGGMPSKAFRDLATYLGISQKDLAAVFGWSVPSLQRRLERGRFEPAESDALLRLMRLLARAEQVLGGSAAAWFVRENVFLGGESPLDYASTEVGGIEVDALLHRMEQGIPG